MTTDSRLSAKHEAFAVLCAGGRAAGAAYAEVYPNASKATAETEGPALLRKPQVKARVAELQREVEKQFTLTRGEWLHSFLRLAKKAEDAGEYAAARGSLREIGLAMPGWYDAQKEGDDTIGASSEVMDAVRSLFNRSGRARPLGG
jgi:hypothetical protein